MTRTHINAPKARIMLSKALRRIDDYTLHTFNSQAGLRGRR